MSILCVNHDVTVCLPSGFCCVWSTTGPVYSLGVWDLARVQSASSVVSCLHPHIFISSKLQYAGAKSKMSWSRKEQTAYQICLPNIWFKYFKKQDLTTVADPGGVSIKLNVERHYVADSCPADNTSLCTLMLLREKTMWNIKMIRQETK